MNSHVDEGTGCSEGACPRKLWYIKTVK